jgi:hypothetical protein
MVPSAGDAQEFQEGKQGQDGQRRPRADDGKKFHEPSIDASARSGLRLGPGTKLP